MRSPIFRDLCGVFEKTIGLVPTLQMALRPFDNRIACAFIYGSVAQQEERATSDVDLMIVGDVGLSDLVPALRKAEQRLGREVNATTYAVDEFRKKILQGDHFLRGLLKKGIEFVKGGQGDLDAIAGQQRS